MIRQALTDLWRWVTGRPPTDGPGGPDALGPRLRLELVAAVPGAVVRLAPAPLVLWCAALVGGQPFAWLTAAVGAVAVVWRPDLPTASVAAVLTALWVFGGGDQLSERAGNDGLLRMAGLVLALHLLLRVTGLAAHVAWRGSVEGAVLARLARSVLGAQLVAQGLLLAVVWLRSGIGGQVAGQEWLRVAAVLAAVGATFLVVPRGWLVRRPRPPG